LEKRSCFQHRKLREAGRTTKGKSTLAHPWMPSAHVISRQLFSG